MSFASAWVDLEIVIKESKSERQVPYDTTYTRDLKYDA